MRVWQKALLSWLLFLVVRLLAGTYRVRVFGLEHRQQAERMHPHGSFCIALWHEHLFASIVAHRQQKFAPLASLSSDGDLVASVMNRFGFQTVRGSSSRRGPEARDELVRVTAKGWFTAITVDGPRGPRRRVKGGVVDVARRAQVAVLPLITLSDRTWELKSWDQFKIPKPFARVAVRYAPPVKVAPDTQGLAFGAAKAAIKAGFESAEAAARKDLELWSAHG